MAAILYRPQCVKFKKQYALLSPAMFILGIVKMHWIISRPHIFMQFNSKFQKSIMLVNFEQTA